MKFRRAWQIFFLLVFVGYMFIWVLLPTKTYKNSWTPKLNEKLNSTYFREQGTNLLLFGFPLMLIAALGSVYLHLEKKSNSESSKTNYRFLRCPAMVMAPLGIVNAVELTFAAMFIALLIWSLANYLYVSFGHLHMHTANEEVWQAKFRSVSLRLGYIGNTCWAFLFFPVTRGSSILPLVGLTSESSIKYHIWLGHVSTVLFAAHSIGFIIYWWAMTDQMDLMLQWSSTYLSNVAGVIAFVLSLGMWVTSFDRVRRKLFEVFFYTHHLYILYVFYMLHVGVAYLCMILPGIFLFLIDRYLRFLQSRQRTRLVSARLLPNGSTELTFAKNPAFIMFTKFKLFQPRGLSDDQWRKWDYSFHLHYPGNHFQSTESNGKVPKVLLITAFKNTADLTMLDLLLPLSGTSFDSKLQLQIEAYITQEHERPLENAKKQIETKLFKPNPSDSPISEALGKNSWLWLSAIISSSFVMFLILLGFVTRYHIYPVELRGELPLQFQNSLGHVSYRELESLPTQSLVQSTNVHFGARPDLKRILFDRKESDVGVLVCGPKSMRHEVAKICASGLAKNLYFESISFNWVYFIWAMLPTKTYKNSWTPKLNEKLNSTYFREQGTNLLLFSFPLMLIAALGCVYLHLQKKSNSESIKSCSRSLRHPAMAMAPLGIVNAVELTFAAMFAALLIWSLANYLYVSFQKLYMDTPTATDIGFIIYWAMTDQMYLMLQWSSTYLSNVAGVIAFVVSLGIMELTFAKNPELSYNPTSILFLHVPSICKLQWHPFTVVSSSNLETDKLSVVIKSQGSWTQKLYKQLSSSLDHLEVSTEGPYGPASSHFLSRESLVMISGGSGITPFISIIREIIFRSTESKGKVPKVLLIAAFKNTTDLTMLDLLLPSGIL
ncbi:UNVERIFIED_CONTAM: Ferric reduction oxidase 4 [Sesamum radiatum]|uniref:Ferric reduction oxidase 4 n=1 Tax=Sesamum radiatum TaxID=300843 RepID=A0AAW2JZQ3_SESRA